MKRIALCCSFMLFPVLALAAPKYTKPESAIQATQTSLTKPTQRPLEEKKKPTIVATDVFSGMGEQLKAVTDSQIKVLQRLIDNTTDDDPEKPDYYFRMAELYAEMERYYNFRARDLDQKIFDAKQAGKPDQVAKLEAQQKDFEKKEKEWLKAAVKEYLLVTNNPKFDNYKRMDQVLFYLAFLLTQQKREDLARPIFKRLIKDYPKSQYIPDAYLSFGEYFFEQKDIENALKFYDKVLQFPESRVYGYARYKEGWCYFNLQDFKKALETFVDVIMTTKAVKGETSKIQLIKEAKKDSVRAYSQVGTPDKAWPFFQRIGGDYAMTMLEQLAELYNSQGKFEDSSKTYRQLMKLAMNSPKLCAWQTEVLRNTLSKTGSRATAESVQELQRLAAVYDKYKTIEGVKREAVEECRDNTTGMLRELATTWHKEAQKTNNKDTYNLAQALYKEYRERFPQEKDNYAMSFYYAELQFKLERYCDAAPLYTDVVKMDSSDKAKYRNESAYAAVISWKNCLNVDDQEKPQQKGGGISDEPAKPKAPEKGAKGKAVAKVEEPSFKPLPIPEKWKKMLDAFDTYIKFVPSSPELVTIKYRKARVFYEYNYFDQATVLFRDIVDHHRDSDLAIYAANLMFDSENISMEFDRLEEDSKKYCPMPELSKDPDFKNSCDAIANGIARKKIERWEKGGQYRKAADEYVRMANEHPDDPRIAELWYNAGVDYEKAHAVGAAIQARSQLIKTKPDDPLAKKAVYLLGRAYQDIAAYTNAAENYESFASKWPGEKAPTDASVALYTASFFRRGLGEVDKAIEDTNLFIKLYGGRKEYEDKCAGVFFGLGQIYEQQKNWPKLVKHLGEYLTSWGSKGGIDRQIIANVKLGEIAWRDSCPVAGVNGACVEITRVRATSATRVTEKASKGKRGRKKGVALPAQCGPETKSKITVHERKAGLAKDAQGRFATAMRLYAGGAATKKIPGKDEQERNARIDAMLYAVAQAKMMEGDAEYEKLLTIKIPEKLDFTPPDPTASAAKQAKEKKRLDEALKKFKGWFDNKNNQILKAQGIYQQVILIKQAHWAIAAAARIGQLFQDYSNQLFTAPVPKAPPSPPGMSQEDFEQMFHDNYCDQMVDKAEPLETKAIEGLSTCLKKSTELSWFNEWSALCEAELNQIKPQEYPLASEIRAVPGYFDRVADATPILTDVATQRVREVKDRQALAAELSRVATSWAQAKAKPLTSAICADVFADFKKVAEKLHAPEGLVNAGVVLEQCGDIKGAESAYRQALNMNGKFAPAMVNLAHLAYRAGAFENAAQLYRDALAADPKNVQGYNGTALVLFDRARAQGNDKNVLAEAIGQLRRALAVDAGSMPAYALLALIYNTLGENDRSKLDLADLVVKQAKEVDDKYPQIYNISGLIKLRKKNVTGALEEFKAAVARHPHYIEANLNIGAITLSARDYKSAEAAFKAVLDAKPTDPQQLFDSTMGMGVALRGERRIDEAEQWYQKAKTINSKECAVAYNMGVLYHDYRDNTEANLAKARGLYTDFVSCGRADAEKLKDATRRIKDVDDTVKAMAEAKKLEEEAKKLAEEAERIQKQQEAQQKLEQQKAQAEPTPPTAPGKPGEKAK